MNVNRLDTLIAAAAFLLAFAALIGAAAGWNFGGL